MEKSTWEDSSIIHVKLGLSPSAFLPLFPPKPVSRIFSGTLSCAVQLPPALRFGSNCGDPKSSELSEVELGLKVIG